MFIANQFFKNILDAGVDNTGVTDSTTAINAAFALGGYWFFPSGTYKVTAPLNMSVAGTHVSGAGYATQIKPASTFVGSQIFNITANYCVVEDLRVEYASSTTSTNPAATGASITSAQGCRIENTLMLYINGWIVESIGGAQSNYNTHLKNVRGYQTTSGFHFKGVTASGFGGIHFVEDCYPNQTRGGDCWFIEDFLDLEAVNIFGEPETAQAGYAFHVKGNCNGIYVTNFDFGLYPSGMLNSSIFIESDANGSPSHIGFSNGITEGGVAGIEIDAGSHIAFTNVHVYSNQTYGVKIDGGTSIHLNNCHFDGNGSVASGTRYDIQSAGTSDIVIEGCTFATPKGTGVNQVDHVINDTAFVSYFYNNSFIGTGFVNNNGDTIQGYPNIVRGNQGVNNPGNIGAPAIGASPYTPGVQAFDYTAYVTGGTVSAIAVGGTVTGLTSGTFRVAAGQTITLTYTVAPTWIWIGD